MPQFRWPELVHDISLAREVADRRPSNSAGWDAIADLLSPMFTTPSKPVMLKGRGCKDRMDRLIQKFRAEDAQSLKR